MTEYKYAAGCEHVCSGNCRRVGCNCECGEFHGYYEEDEQDAQRGLDWTKKNLAEALNRPDFKEFIDKAVKECGDAGCDDNGHKHE